MPALSCRLCGGATTPWTRLRVLGRHDVQYLRCEACGSVQTEPPHWLTEAYRTQGTGLDTGAAQRSLDATLRIAALLALIQWPRERAALDYGAGMGLFARLMRDRGFNFFAYDRYVLPFFMEHFHTDDPASVRPALVTAHEVLEHLPDPAAELPAIFGRGAELVIVTTELFQEQGPAWTYLAPEHGQHVFFYSPRAMALIGERFGYHHGTVPMLQVYWNAALEQRVDMRGALAFANDGPKFGQVMLQEFLNHSAAPYQHAMKDMEAIAKKTGGKGGG